VVGARRGSTSGRGLRNAESRKTQTGHKDPQKTTGKRKGKPEKTKKPKKVAKGNPVGARSLGKSLDPRGGETVVQGGGRGKGNGKGGAPRLGHQVNN
jgi:hypothetical protein